MKPALRFRRDAPPIAWGRPDSPRRALCSICHGPLPEAPLMLWKEDGSCAQFCDDCCERCFEVG
jgi:hypothetical protein